MKQRLTVVNEQEMKEIVYDTMRGDSLETASKAFSLPDISSSDSQYVTCRFRYRCEPSMLVASMTHRRIRTGKCIIRQLSLVTYMRVSVRAWRWTDRLPADDKARQWHFYDDRPRVAASFDPRRRGRLPEDAPADVILVYGEAQTRFRDLQHTL